MRLTLLAKSTAALGGGPEAGRLWDADACILPFRILDCSQSPTHPRACKLCQTVCVFPICCVCFQYDLADISIKHNQENY